MKAAVITLVACMTLLATPIVHIGKINSPDMDTYTLAKINEVFEDVWSEHAIFINVETIPEKNVSQFIQSMELNDSDKVVTGSIMELGEKQILRIDVYNADGTREHVSRQQLSELSEIYTPMIQSRESYYAPIEETSTKMKPSGKHQIGWSVTIGAGIQPKGFSYTSASTGDTLDPPSLTMTDFAIVDAIGTYHDHMLSLFVHFNWRVDMGIGFAYKKALLTKRPHSFTAGLEVGINKLILDNSVALEEENLIGQKDGLMIGPTVGVMLFRDQKINLFTDFGYTWIVSGRNAHYPSVRMGIISYWGKRFKNNRR